MLAADSMSQSNNQAFSTKDRDNEFSLLHCAKERRSGWWHEGCIAANLNSQFYGSKQKKITNLFTGTIGGNLNL